MTLRNPICGSNGVIYQNTCELNKDMCLKQIEITPMIITDCIGNNNIKINYFCIILEQIDAIILRQNFAL